MQFTWVLEPGMYSRVFIEFPAFSNPAIFSWCVWPLHLQLHLFPEKPNLKNYSPRSVFNF